MQERQGAGVNPILMPAEVEHLDGLDALLNDGTVAKWLGGERTRESILSAIDGEKEHWQKHGFGPWVALDPRTRKLIGRGGVRWAKVLERPEVELFYAVDPSFWNKGVASAIASAALELAFSKDAVQSVVAFTIEANKGSQRVVEKLGFAREGMFEHAGLPHILFRLSRAAFHGSREKK